MKGLFFAKPIEFRVETPADAWVQGDALEGTLSMTNRGADPLKKLALNIGLAYGDFKKIKDGEPDAFEMVMKEKVADKVSLKPGAEHRAEWRLQLASDCPISSKEGSLFLFYGGELDDAAGRSKLDLQVGLAPVLETFVAAVENHFSFEARSRVNADGFTMVRFKPPGSYPTMEELGVMMRIGEKKGMELRFQCRLRKFDRVGGGLKTGVNEASRTFSAKKFMLPNGQPNRPLFKSTIEEVLAEVAPPKVEKS